MQRYLDFIWRSQSEQDSQSLLKKKACLFFRLLTGGLAAAAVLISFGAVLGKLNPFQLLVFALIETTVFILNEHLGYKIMGVLDVGRQNVTSVI